MSDDKFITVPNPDPHRVYMYPGRVRTTVARDASGNCMAMTHVTKESARAYMAAENDAPPHYLIHESFM